MVLREKLWNITYNPIVAIKQACPESGLRVQVHEYLSFDAVTPIPTALNSPSLVYPPSPSSKINGPQDSEIYLDIGFSPSLKAP